MRFVLAVSLIAPFALFACSKGAPRIAPDSPAAASAAPAAPVAPPGRRVVAPRRAHLRAVRHARRPRDAPRRLHRQVVRDVGPGHLRLPGDGVLDGDQKTIEGKLTSGCTATPSSSPRRRPVITRASRGPSFRRPPPPSVRTSPPRTARTPPAARRSSSTRRASSLGTTTSTRRLRPRRSGVELLADARLARRNGHRRRRRPARRGARGGRRDIAVLVRSPSLRLMPT